ncbi:Virginiamycin B lyase [Planctomycetes bacterium Poly30]|uniref:Virginiamycin B lyase n=1 Tax=Saltatorellus ferox TaxID=2528018 RepID=A0A518EY75_9BACT|nr:Virginiamycin B lyase [Planctomycetes bacterium Poly30]
MLLHLVPFLLSTSLLACGSVPESQSVQDLPPALFQYPGAPFEAKNGDLWFSSVGAGLVRFDGENFVTFTTKDGLAADMIRSIVEDEEGRLLFATTAGVSRYDGESFTTLLDYEDMPVTRTFSEGGHHRDVWDLHFDRHGTLWITTLAGIFRHDGQKFAAFLLPVEGAPGRFEFTPRFVYSIHEAKDGALWFGTDGAGAVRYDGEAMEVYTAKEHGLASDRVCTILEDGRGDVWFGTSDGGVSRYDGTRFTTHLRSAAPSRHTGWGRYMAIHEDRAGNVWFGASMEGGGVHRWDGESFRYFSVKEGLNQSGIPSIREGRSGTLWVGTVDGVFRLEGERFVPMTK